jgi:hypothetical protein
MARSNEYVHWTLENIVLPHDKLVDTPSMKDGLEPDVEMDLRIYGCELIQLAGVHRILLQLIVRLQKHVSYL